MGGTGKAGDAKKHPKGIKTITRKHGSILQIAFTFRNSECRELIQVAPTAANIKYAHGLLVEIQRKITDGAFRYSDYFPDSPKAALFGYAAAKKTIGDLLRTSLKGYEVAVANGKMSPSTLAGYKKVINGHLIPKFDTMYLKDAAPAFLREWIGGLGVTAKTARNIISPLRSVFDDAVNDELIDHNPLDKIALKRLLTKTSTKSEYEVDPFSDEEKNIILAAAGDARWLFQFAFWSGLRTSELIALKWSDIDWVHGAIRVCRAVVVKTEKGTKTDAGTRDVMMLPLARVALEAQKAHTFLAGDNVFHNPHTGSAWETDKQIRVHTWQYILKRCGVRYRNPYQTRHTYASTLLSAGENPWWVAKQMGHVDVEMVFRHYGKWIPNKEGGAYKPLNDWSSPNRTQIARDGEKEPGSLTA